MRWIKTVSVIVWQSWMIAWSTMSFSASDEFEVELVPILVWNGQTLNPYQINELDELRRSLGELRILHFLSPVYLMESNEAVKHNRTILSQALRDQDLFGLHVAPLVSWARFSGVDLARGQGLYGDLHEACHEHCGLDEDLSGVSTDQLKKLLDVAKMEFEDVGLPRMERIFFEPGFVSNEHRNVALKSGFDSDWSLFNLPAARTAWQRYPVFESNELASKSIDAVLSLADRRQGSIELDQARFGYMAESIAKNDFEKICVEVARYAKTNKRSVRLSLVMNLSSLVHTKPLATQFFDDARRLISDAGGRVVGWQGSHDAAIDWSKLRPSAEDVISESSIPLAEEQIDPEPPVAPAVEGEADQDLDERPVLTH